MLRNCAKIDALVSLLNIKYLVMVLLFYFIQLVTCQHHQPSFGHLVSSNAIDMLKLIFE